MQLQAIGQQFGSRRFSFQAKSVRLGKFCRSQSSVFVDRSEMKTGLAEACTSWQQRVALTDSHGFPVGNRVCLRLASIWHRDARFVQSSLEVRSGSRFKLVPTPSTSAFNGEIKATIATLLPLIKVDGNADVRVKNIALDGNVARQEPLYHNRGKIPGRNPLNKNSSIEIHRVVSPESCIDGIRTKNSTGEWVENCHRHHNVGRNNKISKYGGVGVIFSGSDEGKSYSPDRNHLSGKDSINNGGEAATFRRSHGKDFALGRIHLP